MSGPVCCRISCQVNKALDKLESGEKCKKKSMKMIKTEINFSRKYSKNRTALKNSINIRIYIFTEQS